MQGKTTLKDFTIKTIPLFFQVRTRKSLFIEKRDLFSQFCYSFFFIRSKQSVFLSLFFVTKLCKCTRTAFSEPTQVNLSCDYTNSGH